MRQRLQALERALVCQRAYVVTEPLAADFIDAWETAVYYGTPKPDEHDLIRAVIKKRVPVLALTPLTSYISQCRKDDRTPDLDRVTETIVHGYAQMRLDPTHHCRCH